MDEARIVGDRERVTQRFEDREHLRGRKRAALVEHFAQAGSLDVLEDEVRPAIAERAVAEPAHDVGMVQALDRIELALEPGQSIDRADQLEVQHLDRDEITTAAGVCTPHLSEAAFADQAVELVPRYLERV